MTTSNVTHLRIHYVNDTTWCGLNIVFGRKPTSTINVVTLPDRYRELTEIKWTTINGEHHIDHQAMRLTPEEKAEEKALWNATVSQVTCKRCTKNGTRFQVRD